MKNHFGEFDEGVLKALRKAYNPNANSFSESCEELYDFKTCQRTNGSVYGIPDKSSCQTGKEVKSSVGNNLITDLRMATGRDARKLDIDVMSSLGPDALVKIYADNHISDGGKKQEILAEKAKNRLLGIREGEIDIDSSDMGIFSGLGKQFKENIANSIFVGETTQAQDPTRTSVLPFMIQSDLKKRIEETGLSYELENIKDGLDGVRQLLDDAGDRKIVVDQLAQLGIGGMENLDSGIVNASKVAALVGGMTKEEGMTAKEMSIHGAEVLVDALRTATRGANSSSASSEPSASGSGRENQGNAGRIKALTAELNDPNSNMSPDTRATTRALITALGGTPPQGGPVNEMAPNPNAAPTGMAKFDGMALYTSKDKPEEMFGLKLNRTDKNGVYKGEWSDGYKTEYQFGKDGQMRIVSLLKNKRDVTAAKWISGDGHTVITSKNGAKTVIPEFYPGLGMPVSNLETPND